MKRVCITYHMSNREEDAETCVVLAMDDFLADDLLKNQRGCERLLGIGKLLEESLEKLAKLQGYTYMGFCCAEDRTTGEEEEEA